MIKTDKETNVLLVEESSHPDMTEFIVKNIPELVILNTLDEPKKEEVFTIEHIDRSAIIDQMWKCKRRDKNWLPRKF